MTAWMFGSPKLTMVAIEVPLPVMPFFHSGWTS
jgi:hypothetical protein